MLPLQGPPTRFSQCREKFLSLSLGSSSLSFHPNGHHLRDAFTEGSICLISFSKFLSQQKLWCQFIDLLPALMKVCALGHPLSYLRLWSQGCGLVTQADTTGVLCLRVRWSPGGWLQVSGSHRLRQVDPGLLRSGQSTQRARGRCPPSAVPRLQAVCEV